uniref:Uncharacterized protein n=1 Tax=Siphoviridae sp. ctTIi48 TaxID=2827875 RepID=A0A8S5TLC3_9CAUD|nr:MAG TPA: hypothetical protein [Siphoviridae sp. ctTIi48]
MQFECNLNAIRVNLSEFQNSCLNLRKSHKPHN